MGPLVEFKRRFVAPLAVLIAALALAAPAAAAPTLSGDDPPALGHRDVLPTGDINAPRMAEAFSFKATADGPVDIVNVWLDRHWDRTKVGRPGARLIAGIYGDTNGRPGALLGQGSLTTFTYRAWNTVPIAATELEKGKTYWITFMGLADEFVYRTSTTPCTGTSPSVTSPTGLSALPDPWRTNRVFPTDSPISAYAAERYNVLVFTKGSTGNTTQGVAGLRALARANEVTFDVTDDASAFTESNLAKYRAVVFLNNAGELLNADQQDAFEDYFRGGGGFLGIHSAIEAEPDWQFMSDLLGTRAEGRTDPLSATTKVADRVHIASKGLPEYWTRTDRWYNFTSNVRGFSHVLATVDENTYDPGRRGRLRPSDRLVQGLPGRPLVLHRRRRHRRVVRRQQRPPSARGRARLGRGQGRQGLQRLRRHRVGELPADEDRGSAEHQRADRLRPAARRPDHADRPRRPHPHPRPVDGHVDGDRDDPGLPEQRGRALRSGVRPELRAEPVGVLLLRADQHGRHPRSAASRTRAQTPNGNVPTTPQADPAFWDDWKGYFQLSRFKFVDGPNPTIDLESEQKIMKVEVDRGACCHVAGDMDFDKQNNLWLTTGDDTPATAVGTNNNPPQHDMLTNESQTIAVANATGGTFTLTFDGQTTAPIAFPLVNTEIEAALEALSNIDDVAVTGTGTRTVNFRANQQQKDVPQMTADASGLTSTTPTVTIATSQPGGFYQGPFNDARRSSTNTNDLRGKLLRIKVKDGDISQAEENSVRRLVQRAGRQPVPGRDREDAAGDPLDGLPQPVPGPGRRGRRGVHRRLLAGLAEPDRPAGRPGHRADRDRPQAVQLRLADVLQDRPPDVQVGLQHGHDIG